MTFLKSRSRALSTGVRPALLALAAAAALGSTAVQANELFFNLNKNTVGGNGSPSLFLFGDEGTTLSVANGNGFLQDVTLDATGFFNLALPLAQMTSGTGISNKGFTVTSTKNVGAYLVNRAPFTSDMAYLFDSTSLGKNYVIASQGGGFGEGSQIGVTASQDNTTVTVTPTVGAAVTVTLNKGQTYTYAGGSTNLTGSFVSADKPVAVLSGHECAQVPVGVTACDNLVEQMPSIDRLSTKYVVSETPNTGTAGNLIRVISPTDNNVIKIGGVVVATLNKGQTHEFTLQDSAVIEGSSAILVAQYLKGQSATTPALSDPSMAFVGGRDAWLSGYRLATPTGAQAFTSNYASVVIESAALASLKLNGASFDTSSFADVAGTTLKFGNVLVNGLFTLTASEKFQLMLSGFASFDTYMTTGGTSFAVGASPPPVPEPATLALMLGGLGVMGFVARRRRS